MQHPLPAPRKLRQERPPHSSWGLNGQERGSHLLLPLLCLPEAEAAGWRKPWLCGRMQERVPPCLLCVRAGVIPPAKKGAGRVGQWQDKPPVLDSTWAVLRGFMLCLPSAGRRVQLCPNRPPRTASRASPGRCTWRLLPPVSAGADSLVLISQKCTVKRFPWIPRNKYHFLSHFNVPRNNLSLDWDAVDVRHLGKVRAVSLSSGSFRSHCSEPAETPSHKPPWEPRSCSLSLTGARPLLVFETQPLSTSPC